MRLLSLAARVCAVSALVFVLGATLAWGQGGASTIRGTVTDPQGAVIPGATVTIINLETNLTRSQVTSLGGTFAFELIPPGNYRVEITAEGFRKKVLSPVQALVNLPTNASMQLDVGSVTETVQVEATSTVVQVNTNDATLGNNFVSQQLIQLPLEARDPQALLTLQPGVTRQGYVAGARSDQSNITLDGVDINNAQTNSLTDPVLRLNTEAVEEFRVTTLNANSSQGRSSAAQINLVTKSGTNTFHGAAFEYHRNTIFTANDFFLNRAGVDRPKLIRNTFGGTIGGPIIRDKLFFFYSYEGRVDASEQTNLQVVPRPILGTGQMVVVANLPSGATQNVTLTNNDLQNNIFQPPPGGNSVGLNPLAIQILADAAQRYPVNDTTVGDGLNTGGFRFNFPLKVDNNSNVAKIDWNITNTQTLSARAIFQFDLEGQLPAFPDTPSPDRWSHPWGGMINHTWTFSSNWVNNFRYGYTKQAFSEGGDSSENAIWFRFIYVPFNFDRTFSRTTPVHNIVNDTSWLKGNHTIQFGTNIRLTRNGRVSFANAFDSAVTNPSFYSGGGSSVSAPIRAFLVTQFGAGTTLGSSSAAENAATALIGRFSQYSARFTFGSDGSLLSSGTATERTFATEEYDVYVLDNWKIRRNLTLTYGLRYSISRPVYETGGFEVKPTVPLNEYFRRRRASAFNGVPFNDLLELDLSGPANGRSPMYGWDRNNLQPSVAVAWTPQWDNALSRFFFGRPGRSVIRGGFRVVNDYYGQALAVAFDLNNTLGYTSTTTISANTYNVTTRPAPLFTGFGQDVRSLPGITVPGNLTFPRTQPILSGFAGRRIEASLDEGLTTPINYQWNLTIEREMPHEMVFAASYVGRLGRQLLATRDVMALNNLRDPTSGMDWYTAATELEKIRQTQAPADFSIATIPYFENILPPGFGNLMNASFGCACVPSNFTNTQTVYWLALNVWENDWTDTQDTLEFVLLDNGLPYSLFFHPQYGALSSWGTIANSNYHGMTISMRQRLRTLLWDFNYTFSHSLDDASGLQTSGTYGSAFVFNPILQRDSYADSDFDIRHQVNVNAVYEMPFGRGKQFGSGVNRGVDAVIGGWQISGIFRWNTGLPIFSPYDHARWATNWNVQSSVSPTRHIDVCPTRGDATTAPKLFGCNPKSIYQTFRNAYPGETGPRNIFRLPGYVTLDAGLSKSFTMPWNENHKLQLRWEVFNVTNTQRFGDIDSSRTGFGVQADPAFFDITPPSNWSNFTDTQKPTGANTAGRVMQIGARFQF